MANMSLYNHVTGPKKTGHVCTKIKFILFLDIIVRAVAILSYAFLFTQTKQLIKVANASLLSRWLISDNVKHIQNTIEGLGLMTATSHSYNTAVLQRFIVLLLIHYTCMSGDTIPLIPGTSNTEPWSFPVHTWHSTLAKYILYTC